MSEMKPQALIYCRVSSRSQQTDGQGLESQETRCRQYAAAKGYDVAMVFPDTVTGGGDFMKRPGMVAMLAFMDAQPDIDFIVIFDDLKRYARDVEFHLKLKRAMDARGAVRECLNFNFSDSPEGKFQEIVIAAAGQLEREQNGRQVAQKMKARMQSGYYVLRAPIGYKYEKVQGRGRMLFPHEPFASIIREAFEGYASGRFATQAEVSRFFAQFPDFPLGTNGHSMRQKTADILTHPIYTGYINSEHYDVHWLKGHHEAIVPLELFERVQERRKGVSHAPTRANIGDDFALRGVVACACCGANMRSSWSKGATKHYAYYLCQTKGCEAYGKSVPRDKLEGQVGEMIKTLQPTQYLVRLAKKMLLRIHEAQTTQARDIAKSSQREIIRVEKEIEKLLDRIVVASNETIIRRYEDKIETLERQKALMAAKLANQPKSKGSFEEKLELALNFLASPWKIWESGNVHARRLVLKLAFTAPVTYCRNEGARTPQTSLPFKALGGMADQGVCYGGVGET